MMFKSFKDLIGLDLVRFEAFEPYLFGIDKGTFVRMSWRGRAPPIFRIGHGEPHWSREAVEQWIASEYLKQSRPGEGRKRRRSGPNVILPSKVTAKLQEAEA